MKAIKAVAISILFAIVCLPCFAVFNESDNVAINIFGIAYSAIVFTMPKYFKYVRRFVKQWHKSLHI